MLRALRRGRLMLFVAASHRLVSHALLSPRLVRTQHMALPLRRASRALVCRAGGEEEGWTAPPGFVDWDDSSTAASSAFDEDSPRERRPSQRRQAEPAFVASLEMPTGSCSGCGARFQFGDDAAPGFVPESAYDKRLALVDELGAKVAQRESPLCQRCHGLRFQNRLPADALRVGGDASHEELQPAYFLRMLRDIAKTRCVVVAIVDLFDFHGSLVPDLRSVVGEDNTLILVGNKLDLLPNGIEQKRIEMWVRAESRKARLPELHSVHLVSCKSGTGMPRLLDELKEMMHRRRLDAYVVGAANAGKSSLINHVLRSKEAGRSVTTSALPGTTLDFVRVSALGGRYSLYDTPGVILPNQITTRLSTSELAQIVPKKRAQHVTLRVKEGKSVLLGGIARLHMHSGRPYLFTFYLANAVQIHPTDLAKVDDVLLKHAGELLTPPDSYERLEELGPFDETTYEIKGRGWDEAACDIVLPGLGWVAVTGCGPCTIGVCLPAPVVPIRREPLIPSEGGIRGTMKKSYTKFTGTKLRDGKRNTRRMPTKARAKSGA